MKRTVLLFAVLLMSMLTMAFASGQAHACNKNGSATSYPCTNSSTIFHLQ